MLSLRYNYKVLENKEQWFTWSCQMDTTASWKPKYWLILSNTISLFQKFHTVGLTETTQWVICSTACTCLMKGEAKGQEKEEGVSSPTSTFFLLSSVFLTGPSFSFCPRRRSVFQTEISGKHIVFVLISLPFLFFFLSSPWGSVYRFLHSIFLF